MMVDPLDSSGRGSSIINLLQKSASMVAMNEMKSASRFENMADGDLMIHSLGQETDDDDDYFFLDVENEQEIPLSDANYPPYDKQLTSSLEEAASSNEKDTNIRPKQSSIRKCQSMSSMKSSLAKETALNNNDQLHYTHERSLSLTGEKMEQELKVGLRRSVSQSILKSSPGFSSIPENQLERTTSFSTLKIREYPITLGDNPGGLRGPPISLDWGYDEEQTQVIPLETYEDTRPPRRKRAEMYIPDSLRRWRLLQERRCSLQEMDKAAKAAEVVRKQRKKSITTKPSTSSLKKKIGRLIGSSKNVMD